MKVVLPWPSPALNPNTRAHWSKLAKAKKSYRRIAWALACEAGMNGAFHQDEKLVLEVSFYQPDRHQRDKDNMIASMKSAIDGLSDALGVNDRNFSFVWNYPDELGGQVVITVRGGDDGSDPAE